MAPRSTCVAGPSNVVARVLEPGMVPAPGARLPRLDDEPIAGLVQMREDHLRHIDGEAAGAGDGRIGEVDSHGPPGDLRFTRPVRRSALGWVLCRAVQRETRVTLDVAELDRIGHHPQVHLSIGELDLDPADARRAIGAQGRHRLVLAYVEAAANGRSERRLIRFELRPGGHVPRGYAYVSYGFRPKNPARRS